MTWAAETCRDCWLKDHRKISIKGFEGFDRLSKTRV